MNRKRRSLIGASLFAAAICMSTVAGCAFLSGPPTAREGKYFDFTTNQVPTVVTRTNWIPQTNIVELTITNEVNEVVKKEVEVIVPVPRVYDVTNYHEEIDFTPKASTKATAQSIGAIASIFNPVAGTVTAGLLTGIAGLYARMRSHKKTGGVLAQNIDSMREFIYTLPDGAVYDEAIKAFLRKHQKEEKVVSNVVDLLKNNVDDMDSKAQLTEILGAINALKEAKKPVATATVPA